MSSVYMCHSRLFLLSDGGSFFFLFLRSKGQWPDHLGLHMGTERVVGEGRGWKCNRDFISYYLVGCHCPVTVQRKRIVWHTVC